MGRRRALVHIVPHDDARLIYAHSLADLGDLEMGRPDQNWEGKLLSSLSICLNDFSLHMENVLHQASIQFN